MECQDLLALPSTKPDDVDRERDERHQQHADIEIGNVLG